MSEPRPNDGQHLSGDERVASTRPRLLRRLRTLLSDMSAAWRDPAMPPAMPVLRDYPTRRHDSML